MSKNLLNYTELSYDEIKERIKSRLSEDSRFTNYSESEMYAMLLEIFSATTDFTNFYIERRAQESFPGTAQLRSSITELSKMLGYVIRRPEPSQTSVNITLTSLPNGVQVDDVFTLKKFSNFTFNGLNFILKQPIQYKVTQQDINNFANPNYFKVFEFYSSEPGKEFQIFDTELIAEEYRNPIELIQAELKEIEISQNDTQADQRYQIYKIDDKEFSNFYGDEDFGFDIDTGDSDVTLNVTRVAIGSTSAFCKDMSEFDSKREFIIDRRSFLNNSTIPLLTATDSGKNVKYCVIRTNMDDTVELRFADDVISSIGAKGTDSIFVRYLSTKGSAGNFVGVIGRKIECQQNSFGFGFSNSNIKFALRKNVVGGSNIEDIESIKINAPNIFYSLDRCVTSRDYINFLKTLAIKGKQIKNARVWGEQEETRDNFYQVPNIKLFNVVLFSILADLYKKDVNGKYINLEEPEDILLSTSNSNDWFTLMVTSDSTTPLKDSTLINSENSDLKILYDKIYTRSEITVKNIYVTPELRNFKIGGYIYLNPLVDKTNVYNKITDAIYTYLSKYVDFNTPVYISNIIEIVESFSEVDHADIYFVPLENPDLNYLFTSNTTLELSAISANFNSLPIGHVFNSSVSGKDKCDIREYSISGVDTSFEFYKKTISPYLSAYSENTINAICCLMPRLEMKMYKFNSELVRTEPIWPSNNSIDSLTCGLPISTSGDINWDFVPSERNLYMGIMKCLYDNLMKIVYRNPTLSKTSDDYIAGINKMFDEFLANRDSCFCSLRKISEFNNEINAIDQCKIYLQNADPNEINTFVNNDLLIVLDLFKNTMANVINYGLLDSYGNIVNYSLRNEIARIKAPETNQYLYK